MHIRADSTLKCTPPKFIKEPRSRGCEAQAVSRPCVNFLSAIREVRCGINSLRFLREILQGSALSGILSIWKEIFCWIFSKGNADEQKTPVHSSSLRWFYGRKTWGIFCKKIPQPPLKCLSILQQCCCKITKSFWRFKGNFFQKVPLRTYQLHTRIFA